jgi:WD40 repeat protein
MNLDEATSSRSVRLGPHPGIAYVAITPDGRWVATGAWRGTGVKVWDAREGALARELDVEGGAAVAFSPDGRWLVTKSQTECRFWQVGTWRVSHCVAYARVEAPPNPVLFSPDGKMLAMTRSRTLVQLVDPETGRQYATLAAPDPSAARLLCFSPDSSRLVVHGSDLRIRIWDLRRIRRQLAELNLDWNLPPYPPPTPAEG